MKKRMTAALLALVLALGLTGCKKSEDKGYPAQGQQQNNCSEQG